MCVTHVSCHIPFPELAWYFLGALQMVLNYDFILGSPGLQSRTCHPLRPAGNRRIRLLDRDPEWEWDGGRGTHPATPREP